MDAVEQFLDAVGAVVWGPVLLILLIGAGLYFTLGTRALAFRRFGLFWRVTFGALGKKKNGNTGGITPFQAVSTALASTVGTGNVVGVSAALILGGPGAIFWMWVSAALGMMTKYAEVVLALKYRTKDKDGGWMGGPMFVIARGLKKPLLAGVFALFGMLASFGIGNMTQANALAGAVSELVPVSRPVIGLVLMVLAGLVIFGGIRGISRVTSFLVPFMAGFYILGCLAVLVLQAQEIPRAFALIFREAFRVPAMAGGLAGYTMARALRIGVARGVFSNEAGLGSAAIAHAAADAHDPVEQGLWGAMEVFLDTLVICTLTALVILTSGVFAPGAAPDAPLTLLAFENVLGPWGRDVVGLSVSLFAVATILGWCYYGETCCAFLFRRAQARARRIYRLFYLAAIFLGANARLGVVWGLSDILNGLMALPNLIALFCLSGLVFRETRRYEDGL